MTGRVEVCATADIPDHGDCEVVQVNGVEVGVFNVEGEYHALLNSCPHQRGPVCEGELVRGIGGEYGGTGVQVEERYTGEHTVVCPWHGWSFDVRTGVHSGDVSVAVQTYDVVVTDGTIYLDV